MSSSVTVRPSSSPALPATVHVRFTTGLERNRMTRATIDELQRTITGLGDDPSVGMVLIGSGVGDFSAGADLGSIADASEAEEYVEAEYDLFARVEASPAVTVALVDGYCLGNAAELSLACDFRVAGPRLHWGFPEARIGLMAPVSRLLRQVPRSVATRLAMGAPWLDSAGALSAGAVDVTVTDIGSEPQLAEALAELTRATPAGARWTKQALRDAREGRNRETDLAVASMAEAAAAANEGVTDEDP